MELDSGMSSNPPNVPAVNLKSPPLTAVLMLAASFASFVSGLHARVGETQDAVERRLLQPNLGKVYFRAKEKDVNPRELERQQAREEKDQPFHDSRPYFPSDTREGIYWKSAVANQMSSDSGWKVHVFYAGGRSMLEAYKRVGDSLNEFEIRALLSANRGASSWKKVSGDGGGTNGIGYDYELEDGSLRAKQQGNWLMIFSTKLDNYVVDQQKAAKDIKDRELAKQKQEQSTKAPESVLGL